MKRIERVLLAAWACLGCGPDVMDQWALRQALPSTSLVISQVYGAGDTSSPAPAYRTDFIELRNLSSQPVALAGYTLQYASVLGSNWLVADFDPAATVAPLGYHLVAFSAGMGTRGPNLPPADTTNALINVGRAEFKVALVSGPTALRGDCPLTGADAARIVDFVGAGTANCSEGVAAPTASVSTSLQRRGGGCLDTDRNADDFEALPPTPRNALFAAAPCLADGGSPPLPDAGPPPPDAGADGGPQDAGSAGMDAGASAADAGPVADAGGVGGGTAGPDAGPQRDGGTSSDAGNPDAGTSPPLSARSGCRCSGVDPLSVALALGVLTVHSRRRRARRSSE